jgi:ABC-type polysaccharide/polyol phosphate export permease
LARRPALRARIRRTVTLVSMAVARAHPEVDPVAPDGKHLHPPRPAPETRLIRPVKRRLRLRDVPRSLPIIRVIAARDIRAKYKQSALGPLWLLAQPLGMLGAFTLVFDGVTNVDTGGVPYPLFGLVGLCVWSYFQIAVSIGGEAIVGNATFLKRVLLPRFTLPAASLFVAAPVLIATVALALIGILISGEGFPLQILLLPVALIWLLALVAGVVTIFSSLAAVSRDVRGILPFMLQVGVFISPVAYPIADASSGIVSLLSINPLTGLIEFWRWSLLAGHELQTSAVIMSAVVTLLLVISSWRLFTRLEVSFADVV